MSLKITFTCDRCNKSNTPGKDFVHVYTANEMTKHFCCSCWSRFISGDRLDAEASWRQRG